MDYDGHDDQEIFEKWYAICYAASEKMENGSEGGGGGGGGKGGVKDAVVHRLTSCSISGDALEIKEVRKSNNDKRREVEEDGKERGGSGGGNGNMEEKQTRNCEKSTKENQSLQYPHVVSETEIFHCTRGGGGSGKGEEADWKSEGIVDILTTENGDDAAVDGSESNSVSSEFHKESSETSSGKVLEEDNYEKMDSYNSASLRKNLSKEAGKAFIVEASMGICPVIIHPDGEESSINADGLLHLTKMLIILEQLEDVRRTNRRLQRKCEFLQDTQSLFKYQNNLLLSEVKSKRRRILTSATRPIRGVSHSLSYDPSFLKEMAFYTDPDSLSSAAKRGTTATGGTPENDPVDARNLIGAGKSVEKQSRWERKKSKKLQAKWEQVKKVFSGKTENSRRLEEDVAATKQPEKERKRKRHLTLVTLNDVALNFYGLEKTVFKEDLAGEQVPSSPSSVKSEPMDCEGKMEMDGEDEQCWIKDSGVLTRKLQCPRHSYCSSSSGGIGGRTFVFPDTLEERRESLPVTRKSFDAPSIHLSRSKSFKVSTEATERRVETEMQASSCESKSLPSSPVEPLQERTDCGDLLLAPSHGVEPGRKARAAWGKVKSMINTRRESFKAKGQAIKNEGQQKGEGQRNEENHQKLEDHEKDEGHVKDRFLSVDDKTTGLEDSAKGRNDDGEAGATPLVSSLAAEAGIPCRCPSASPRYSPVKDTAVTRRRDRSISPPIRGESRRQFSSFSQGIDDPPKGMKDEPNRKRASVREKSSRKRKMKPVGRAKSVDNSVVNFTKDFINKMEEWEEKQKLAASTHKSRKCGVAERSQSPDQRTSSERLEMLSESFTKTVQRWEEVRDGRREKSREGRRALRGNGQENRSASRERSKSAHRLEKELNKIGKKEQKLESELQKLMEMKQKLESSVRDNTRNAESLEEKPGTNDGRNDVFPPGVLHNESKAEENDSEVVEVMISSSEPSVTLTDQMSGKDGLDLGKLVKNVGSQTEPTKEGEEEPQRNTLVDYMIGTLEKELRTKDEKMEVLNRKMEELRGNFEELQLENKRTSNAVFASIAIQTVTEPLSSVTVSMQTEDWQGMNEVFSSAVDEVSSSDFHFQTVKHRESSDNVRKFSEPCCLLSSGEKEDPERRFSAEDEVWLRSPPSAFRPIFCSEKVHRRKSPRVLPCFPVSKSDVIRRFKPIVVRSNEVLDKNRLEKIFFSGTRRDRIKGPEVEEDTNCVTKNREEKKRQNSSSSRSQTVSPSKNFLVYPGDRRRPSRTESDFENVPRADDGSTSSSTKSSSRAKSDCTNSCSYMLAADTFVEGQFLTRVSPFRKSPSPLIMRNLKTAAELMADSEKRKQRLRSASSETAVWQQRKKQTPLPEVPTSQSSSQRKSETNSKETDSVIGNGYDLKARTGHNPVEDESSVRRKNDTMSLDRSGRNPTKRNATTKLLPMRAFALCSVASDKDAPITAENCSSSTSFQSDLQPSPSVSSSEQVEVVGPSGPKMKTFFVTASNPDRCAETGVTGTSPGSPPGKALETPELNFRKESGDEKKTKERPSRRSGTTALPSSSRRQTEVPVVGEVGVRSLSEQRPSGGQAQRTKTRFLDGSWISKSKRFFKSSK